MSYNAVTVTNTPTLIVGANCRRQELTLVNNSSVDIFVGPDASITSSNAVPLFASQRNDRWKGPGGSWLGDIYGVTASGSADIRFWEVER